MIGNDVVDIIQSRKESNWQRKGYLLKIFTTEEQLLIHNYNNPEIMVWRLWSMKEAAYKIYNRQTKIRAYIPHQLICTISGAFGTVTCNGRIYYTKTIFDANAIYTVATINEQALLNSYELTDCVIVKDTHGHPYVYNSKQKRLQPVSVTHHGRYHKVVALDK